jgi:hypothetical protein
VPPHLRGAFPDLLNPKTHCFKRELGDLRLGEITREKAREFRDAVAKVPSALPRNLRKLPLPELLRRHSGFR